MASSSTNQVPSTQTTIQTPQITPLTPQHISTPVNAFGLSKRFYATELPDHSPDDNLTIQDLADHRPKDHASSVSSTPADSINYFPYPNKSSFALGNWFWNTGVQKSRSNFRSLVEIISDADFDLEDIKRTNWAEIDATLSSGGADPTSVPEWLDDGWKASEITIQVPFHQRTENPGTREYVVGELYHRSLVSVVKERLETSDCSAQFHFDPYELLWTPRDGDKPVRVYGEMYSSDEFLAMHRDLLNSPPEPSGCNAPRVIIPLMFWSDVTHLTSFGQAKLWPLYVIFGNDTKYKRCKPSANLCSHVAYFQKVIAYLCQLVSLLISIPPAARCIH
jgi:hypothetical protein